MKALVLLLLVLSTSLHAKIRFLTFHFNRPDFIELQYKTLKRFIEDDYELIVFNDANTKEREEGVRSMCEKYGITCIRFEPEWHTENPLNHQILRDLTHPSLIHSHISFGGKNLAGISQQLSVRHCHVIQYALDNFGYGHDDIVVILDGDIFPIRQLNLRTLMKKNPLIGSRRMFADQIIDYFWVPFVAFDPKRLPRVRDLKFHVSLINGYIYDTGAASFYYLRENPRVHSKMYDYHSSTPFYESSIDHMERSGFNENEIELTKTLPWPQCVEFHIDHHFLHYGASSFGLEGHDLKTASVVKFIERIIAE